MILLHNKVVLEYQYEEPKSKEGILLSQSENTFKKGKITMVGAGVDIASSIKIGNSILYTNGQEVNFEGKKYILVDVVNIVVIL